MSSCLLCRDHLRLPRTKAAGETGDLMVTRVAVAAGGMEVVDQVEDQVVAMTAGRRRRPRLRRSRSIRGAIRLHLPIRLVPWETCTGIAAG